MFKSSLFTTLKCVLAAAPLAFTISAGNAHAQVSGGLVIIGGGSGNPGPGFPGGGLGGPLSIQDFALQGSGCPSSRSANVFLDDRSTSQLITVEFFDNGNGGSFLVNGPNDTRDCTIGLLLGSNGFGGFPTGPGVGVGGFGFDPGGFGGFGFDPSGGFSGGGFSFGDGAVVIGPGIDGSDFQGSNFASTSNVSVRGVRAFVDSNNRGNGDQLTVRSRTSLNGFNSQVNSVRVNTTANQTRRVNFRPNLSQQTGGTFELFTAVQLQASQNNDGAHRIQRIEIELESNSFDNGGF